MKKKFLRQDYMRHIKLGKNRKKIQKWRKPKGRHSKMRKKRKGYPISPRLGYKSSKKSIIPIIIHSMNELKNLNNKDMIIIGKKVGARKKIEIIRKAEEMKIRILNASRRKNEIK